jgi:hypothetical protein
MKHLITVAVMLAVFAISVGPIFAVMDPPKVPPKGTEGPDIRQNTMPPFTGPEGPDTR